MDTLEKVGKLIATLQNGNSIYANNEGNDEWGDITADVYCYTPDNKLVCKNALTLQRGSDDEAGLGDYCGPTFYLPEKESFFDAAEIESGTQDAATVVDALYWHLIKADVEFLGTYDEYAELTGSGR